jgi:adenosine deaminase
LRSFDDFLLELPKAELHLHIEGTLEPELLIKLSEKHGVTLPYKEVSDVEQAYAFEDLQSFLDLYYLGASVLIDEDDFFELMWAYLLRCRDENIVHTEIMFDPQTHTGRGIAFEVFMGGFTRAMDRGQAEWGQSASLIMSFLRHLPEESALETLEMAAPFKEQIQAIGLDSSEMGHPPEKFANAYAMARDQGYLPVAHAGEEGPPAYITGALDKLKVVRVDHGVRCLEDAALVERLIAQEIPLTVCPLSNVRLCVYDNMEQHPILEMLEQGLKVCVNSDDPPYFGGYLLDNFRALHDALGMTAEQAITLARNSFTGSFLDEATKSRFLDQLDQVSVP